MSPNNPGNFVNDLVEMAKAFEALPKVQAELADAHVNIELQSVTIQRLELKLLERANEVQDCLSRIRKLEEEKDATETMFLEADDRTARALDFIKATFGNAGSLIQALEPAEAVEPLYNDPDSIRDPNAVPMFSAEPEGLHTTTPSGQSEPLPPSPMEVSSSLPKTQHGSPELSASPSPAPEVAPAHPTSNVSTNSTEAKPELVSASAIPEVDASGPVDQSFSMPSASPGRYAGRCYSEVTASGDYPNRAEWEANGGTVDNWFA